jgi:hypothetical protein
MSTIFSLGGAAVFLSWAHSNDVDRAANAKMHMIFLGIEFSGSEGRFLRAYLRCATSVNA